MIGSSRSYAIGMAHFQIAGGLKSLVIVCITYLVLFGAGLSLFYYADMSPRSRSALPPLVVGFLLLFETVVLVLLGSARVSSAIRTDVISKMIESHRLMPIPAWRAVAGYLFGSTTHAIAFAAVNAALSYIFAAAAHASMTQLTLHQALIFLFALLIWTATALGTLLFRHAYAIALIGLLLGGFGVVVLYMFVPGFALLVGPMMGDSIYSFTTPSYFRNSAYPASICAQLAFIALLFAAACRRYRGTFPTTFTALQSLLLILVWCAASTVGLALWEGFRFHAVSGPPHLRYPQVVGSTLAAMVLLLIPARTLTAAPPRRRTLLLSIFLMLACILFITLIPLGRFLDLDEFRSTFETDRLFSAIAITALVVAAHAFLLPAAFYALRRTRPLVTWVTLIASLLLLWIGPLLLELIRVLIQTRTHPYTEDTAFGILGTLSPVGLLITTWTASDPLPSPVIGLLFQWCIPIALCLALFLLRNRPPRIPPVSQPAEPNPALAPL